MNLLSESRRITEPLSLIFTTSGGWHLITISARVKSEKQRGKNETDDEDLTVRVDDKTFPHPGSEGRLKDSPAAFSGGQLHNKLKTIYFILQFVPGEHQINLEPQHGAEIVEVAYGKVELEGAKLHLPLEKQAEKANGRPWVTFDFGTIPKPPLLATITVSGANLRKKPTQESESLRTLDKDTVVEVRQKMLEGDTPYKSAGNFTNIWHKIRFKETEGYVFSEAVEIDGEDKETIKQLIIDKANEISVFPKGLWI